MVAVGDTGREGYERLRAPETAGRRAGWRPRARAGCGAARGPWRWDGGEHGHSLPLAASAQGAARRLRRGAVAAGAAAAPRGVATPAGGRYREARCPPSKASSSPMRCTRCRRGACRSGAGAGSCGTARRWSPRAGGSRARRPAARCACTRPSSATGSSACPRPHASRRPAPGTFGPGAAERLAIGSITCMLVPRALDAPAAARARRTGRTSVQTRLGEVW